jgi:hypothetical protein
MERTFFGPQVCSRSTSLPVFVTPCWTLKGPPGRLIAAGGRCFLVRPCAHPCATLCDLVLPCARRVVCLGVLGGTSATHVPCALPCALRLFRAPVDLLFQWAPFAIPLCGLVRPCAQPCATLCDLVRPGSVSVFALGGWLRELLFEQSTQECIPSCISALRVT